MGNSSIKTLRRNLYLLFFLLAVWIAWIVLSDNDDMSPLKIAIGDPVPSLHIENLYNQSKVLKPVPGKLLIINVWATWCAPCRKELPSLQRLANILGDDRLELVGLSVDEDEHLVREYLNERNILFPNFIDRDSSEVEDVLGVRLYPSTFFVAPSGRLLRMVEGSLDWDVPAEVAAIRSLMPDG